MLDNVRVMCVCDCEFVCCKYFQDQRMKKKTNFFICINATFAWNLSASEFTDKVHSTLCIMCVDIVKLLCSPTSLTKQFQFDPFLSTTNAKQETFSTVHSIKCHGVIVSTIPLTMAKTNSCNK